MKQAPEEVQQELLNRGGRNRFGEPNYRCVWSDDRLDWIGGEWNDFKDDCYKSGVLLRRKVEVRQSPKYFNFPHRWIIERWVPPETYGSPESWQRDTVAFIDGQSIPQLGPYPSRGDYELAYICQDDAGEFIPVTRRLASVVVDLVEASRRLTSGERWLGVQHMQEMAAKKWEAEADKILSDNEPFHGLPNSANPKPVLELKEEHRRANVTNV